MALLAFALSLLIAALGAVGVFSPQRLIVVVQHFQAPAGLYAAAVLRLVFGAALFLVAPTSRTPEIIRIIGVIAFVAGLITPLFGLERFRKLLDWWVAQGPVVLRLWASFAFGFGLWLAYAIMPSLRAIVITCLQPLRLFHLLL